MKLQIKPLFNSSSCRFLLFPYLICVRHSGLLKVCEERIIFACYDSTKKKLKKISFCQIMIKSLLLLLGMNLPLCCCSYTTIEIFTQDSRKQPITIPRIIKIIKVRLLNRGLKGKLLVSCRTQYSEEIHFQTNAAWPYYKNFLVNLSIESENWCWMERLRPKIDSIDTCWLLK